MSDFHPVKTLLADYPHPPGTVMRGSMGSLSTVVDRGGYAFLACCTVHDVQGVASGYYVMSEDGRILDRSVPAGIESYVCPHVPGQLLG